MRELKKDFRRMARLAQINYKDRMENKLTSGDEKEGWQDLSITMGRAFKPALVDCPDHDAHRTTKNFLQYHLGTCDRAG